MTKIQKEQIIQKLRAFINHVGSPEKAANIIGVSNVKLRDLVAGKIGKTSDEIFLKVADGVGWSPKVWEGVMTRDFQDITGKVQFAQENNAVIAITGEAGTGKSYALSDYSATHSNAYLLRCSEFWNRKFFLSELLRVMGRDFSGLTVAEMVNEVVVTLKKKENPVLLLDEADKLSDQVLYFFITIYNELEDKVGFVLCATDHLSKRIKRGLKLNKKGYKEIYSRCNRKFVELKGVSEADIIMICKANGIAEKRVIKKIIDDSDLDLRRVKQMVRAYLHDAA
ncbi:ATP-binding protein [Flammeovirga sp. MY04]|uniref:ATP-binding protein n=1 Tax=Flammeovirga sp. MY04 TaxID=1191459 RepID=UPI00080619B6|nr:ATP-binding protein [Flammeovirga sp. MY04]ANQ49591.1 ATP-binding protein [Flammeovirga sp. MY04]ANQ52109.1 ATP-binding protein [Flammeovirga sp. MY04]